MPNTAEAGVASFLTGLLTGYAGQKQHEWAMQERDKEYQRRLEDRARMDERERQRRMKVIGEGSNLFKSLLDPSVNPQDAMLKLSEFDQAQETHFTPVYGEVLKARQAIPYTKGPSGEQVKNPYYVPKYIPRVETVPDVKNNRLWEQKGLYDPKTNEWQKDQEGKRVLTDVNSLGKLFDTQKSGAGGKGVSAALQENLNKLASGYIKSLAAQKAVEQGKDTIFQGEFGGTDEAKYQAAKTAADKGAATSRLNLDTWVNQVLPAAENAEPFMSAITKAAKGKTVPPEYFWKKVVGEYKKGTLNDLDVQLLAYKHLTMYGNFPKGYIPAFKTAGEVVPTQEDTQDENQD
jgi:hypothetical protein